MSSLSGIVRTGLAPQRPPGPAFVQSSRAHALHKRNAEHGGLQPRNSRLPPLYAHALDLVRLQEYAAAREAFQMCCTASPHYIKAWVSWAQFEKRVLRDAKDPFAGCRGVLQRGLTLNPGSAALFQAWGLMELQRNNVVAAVLLLERCARHDPRCMPVLRWKAVVEAKQKATTLRRSVARNTRRAAPPTGPSSFA